jgi:hypothetical protein
MVITLIYLKQFTRIMASNREERKDEEVNSTIPSLSLEKQQQQIREAIVDAFDEAKGNTERALKEAKREFHVIERPLIITKKKH